MYIMNQRLGYKIQWVKNSLKYTENARTGISEEDKIQKIVKISIEIVKIMIKTFSNSFSWR